MENLKLAVLSLLISIPIDIIFLLVFNPSNSIAFIFGFLITFLIRLILELFN